MSAAAQRSEQLRKGFPQPRRPKLREVKPQERSARRPKLGWLSAVSIVAVMAVVFGAAALQTLIIQDQVRIDELQRSLDAERAIEADLLLEVASLEAPGRILSEASSVAAMVPPSNRVFLAPIIPGNREAPIDPPGDDPFPGSDRSPTEAESES